MDSSRTTKICELCKDQIKYATKNTKHCDKCSKEVVKERNKANSEKSKITGNCETEGCNVSMIGQYTTRRFCAGCARERNLLTKCRSCNKLVPAHRKYCGVMTDKSSHYYQNFKNASLKKKEKPKNVFILPIEYTTNRGLVVNLSKIEVGESFVYHTGNLGRARFYNKTIDNFANEIFKLSTGAFPEDAKGNMTQGTGEFELSQRIIKEEVETTETKRGETKTSIEIVTSTEYCAKRIKPPKKRF